MSTRHCALAMPPAISLAMLFSVLLLAVCGDGATPNAAERADSVATVDGKEITRSEFEVYVQSVERQSGREVPKEQEPALLNQFIDMRLAAAAAEKTGVAKDAKVQQQIELARMNVLVDAGLQKYLDEHPVSDAELKPEYEAQVAALPREYHARHILVEDQATAAGIVKELEGGADFAKIASERSKDPSGKNGGDLGWFTLDSMVKPFADAVAALEKGRITAQPVQSQFGWHVIRLEDSRQAEAPAFDEVKERVRAIIQRKKLQAYLEELRKSATIEKKI